MNATRNCLICDIGFTCSTKSKQKYCSRSCSAKSQMGENNPNYGNRWSEEQKKKQSEKIKSVVDDAYREKCAKANKGKNFSDDRIFAMHGNRKPESYSRRFSEETKRKIGIKSAQKFTPEYKIRQREKYEELGLWVKLEDKSDMRVYYELSNWNFPLYDFFGDNNLLKERRLFNPKKNSKGVVRDHKFSRMSGFEFLVYPEILRHIENCEIMTHSDNVKKHVSKNIDSDSISLKELFDNIRNTSYNWPEQQICLALIEDYENGKRWSRKEASE